MKRVVYFNNKWYIEKSTTSPNPCEECSLKGDLCTKMVIQMGGCHLDRVIYEELGDEIVVAVDHNNYIISLFDFGTNNLDMSIESPSGRTWDVNVSENDIIIDGFSHNITVQKYVKENKGA